MAITVPLPDALTKKGFAALPNKALRAHYAWSKDLEVAGEFCRLNALEIHLTDADYQVARITGNGIRLVIYPHRTSAGNYHLRIRNENSTNPERAREIMIGLDNAKPFWCTFSHHWDALPKVSHVG